MDASPFGSLTPSAAHRVFASHVLSTAIFSSFDYRDAKPSLASLAGTCKMFFKPAIGVLWYEVDTFFVILHTLPSDCWGWADKWRHLAVLKREFSKEECGRLLLYTSQIRSFELSGHFRATDLKVYQHFSKVFQPRELFPCLRNLKWKPKEDDIFQFVKLFLGPQLEHIEIGLGRLSPARASILPALESCSTLKTVLLLETFEKKDMIKLSKVVTHWNQLQTLEIFYVSAEVLVWLASHPSLTTLRLGSVKNIDWDVVRSKISKTPFPVLNNLEMQSAWMESTAKMIEIAKPRVEKFKMTFEETSSKETWKGFLEAIHNGCDQNNLSHLDIREFMRNWLTEPARNQRRIPGTTLSSLFAFKSLTYLRIVSSCGYDFDDTFLLDLAQSLPKIQTLRLMAGREYDNGKPSITLDALAHLSRHCRYLEDLGIEIVAEPEEVPESSSFKPGDSVCPLQRLFVGNSPVKHPIRVAHLLSDWFPCLEEIWTEHPQSGEFFLTKRAPRWHKVMQFVSGMTIARRQERNSGSTSVDPEFEGLSLNDEDSLKEEDDEDDEDEDEDEDEDDDEDEDEDDDEDEDEDDDEDEDEDDFEEDDDEEEDDDSGYSDY